MLVRDLRYHDRRTTKHRYFTHGILGLLILGGIGSACLIWYESYLSDQSSMKIDELVQGKNQLLTNIASLRQEIETKNAEIKRISEKTDVLAGFSDMGALNPAGLPYIEGTGIRLNSPLADALRGLYVITNNSIHYNIGSEHESKYRKVIDDHPRFPFAYVALMELLRNKGDPSWRSYAEQAVTILTNTTSLSGHNPAHDDALRQLKGILEQRNREQNAPHEPTFPASTPSGPAPDADKRQ